jgi:hypothetical protein
MDWKECGRKWPLPDLRYLSIHLYGGIGENQKRNGIRIASIQSQELTPFVCASSRVLCDFIFCSRAIIELITSEDKQMMLMAQEAEDGFSD